MTSCRFLFIYPDINEVDASYDGNKGSYYYGVAQLSSVLRQAGVETGLLHYIRRPSKDKLLDDVRLFNPDIIGFSSTTMMIADVNQWTRWLRESNCATPLILGGSHATLDYQAVTGSGLFDVIFVGESEESLVEYCQHYREHPTNILGTVARSGDKYIFNPSRQLVSDLDKYPFPDWELFDYNNLYEMRTHKRGMLMSSRGCPYRCSFCSNDRYINLYLGKGKFVRMNSVDYIIRQAKQMKKQYSDIRYFQFVDDVFGSHPEWLKEFSQRWPKEVGMDFYGNMNANACGKDTIRLLAQSGCRRLQIGVETGNESRRRDILKKPVLNMTLEKVVNECHNNGVEVVSLNMIGLPFETIENIFETIHFNARLKPKLLQCTIFFPFPHTYLYDYCVENKLLNTDVSVQSDYFRSSGLINPNLPSDALGFFRDNFRTLVKIYQYVNIDWLINLLGFKIAGKLVMLFRSRNELKKWLYKPRGC